MLLRPPLKIEVFEQSPGRWGARGELSTDHGPIWLQASAPAALLNDWQSRFPRFGALAPPPAATSTAEDAAWQIAAKAHDSILAREDLERLRLWASRPVGWRDLATGASLASNAMLGDRAAIGFLQNLALASAGNPAAAGLFHGAELVSLLLPASEVRAQQAPQFGGYSLPDVLRWANPREAAIAAREHLGALTGVSPVQALGLYRPDLVRGWQ